MSISDEIRNSGDEPLWYNTIMIHYVWYMPHYVCVAALELLVALIYCMTLAFSSTRGSAILSLIAVRDERCYELTDSSNVFEVNSLMAHMDLSGANPAQYY